jgi:hypothetical protein
MVRPKIASLHICAVNGTGIVSVASSMRTVSPRFNWAASWRTSTPDRRQQLHAFDRPLSSDSVRP